MSSIQSLTSIVPTADQITDGLNQAVFTWTRWQCCFGHSDEIASNLILKSELHFGLFVWEYGVAGSIDWRRSEIFRKILSENSEFHQILKDGNYKDLVKFIKIISQQCGKKYGPKPGDNNFIAEKRKNMWSLMSKVCGFLNPVKFLPFDSYASEGLSKLAYGNSNSFNFGFTENKFISYFDFAYKQTIDPSANLVKFMKEADAVADRLGAARCKFRLRTDPQRN